MKFMTKEETVVTSFSLHSLSSGAFIDLSEEILWRKSTQLGSKVVACGLLHLKITNFMSVYRNYI